MEAKLDQFIESLIDDDEEDDIDPLKSLELSISDRLHVGYSHMDRACQTDSSEFVNLKKIGKVLSVVVSDLATLKQSFYCTKLTLQSEYDRKLEDVATELYSRVNKRIAEIEENHRESVHVVRKSYKTQITNALCKLSKDYEIFYGDQDAMEKASHKKQLELMKQRQEELRRKELAQKDMLEMLKLEMDKSKLPEKKTPSPTSSVVSAILYQEEIEELKHSMNDYESRIDNLEILLEETNEENEKLKSKVNELNAELLQKEKKGSTLNAIVGNLNAKIEIERKHTEKRLKEQKEDMTREMESEIARLQQQREYETNKETELLKRNLEELRLKQELEDERLKQIARLNEQKRLAEEAKQIADFAHSKLLDDEQLSEITRLKREIQRVTKLSLIREKVLNEQIHALKDEMFLRASLQRQTAKMNHASPTYGKHGSKYIPLGVNPVDKARTIRKLQLPNIIGSPVTSSPKESRE